MNEERPTKTLLIVSVGAVLLACAGVYVSTNRWNASPSSMGETGSDYSASEETLRVLEDQVVRGAQDRARSERALSEGRVSGLLQQAGEAKGVALKAQEVARRWQADVPALLTSEAGRRLASNPVRVATFAAVTQRSGRPSEESLAALLQRLETLESELRRIRSTSDAVLSTDMQAEFATQLAQDRASAGDALDGVQGDLASIDSLLAQAAAAPPAGMTLEAVLAELKREQDEKRALLIAAELRRVSDEQNELDKEMEAARATRIAEAKRQKRDAELQAEESRILGEAEITRKQAEGAARRQRAESPTVQALYAPLLTKGLRQPENKAGIGWSMPSKSGPQGASLSRMKYSRGLDSFDIFLTLMTDARNDRPSWPPIGNDAALAEEYRRRFTEFKELAPLWVEMGLLQK